MYSDAVGERFVSAFFSVALAAVRQCSWVRDTATENKQLTAYQPVHTAVQAKREGQKMALRVFAVIVSLEPSACRRLAESMVRLIGQVGRLIDHPEPFHVIFEQP